MNNSAAIGYALLAAKRMGFTKKQLQQLEATMRDEMDFVTEEEAEEVCRKN